jgi:hypothetical protein
VVVAVVIPAEIAEVAEVDLLVDLEQESAVAPLILTFYKNSSGTSVTS